MIGDEAMFVTDTRHRCRPDRPGPGRGLRRRRVAVGRPGRPGRGPVLVHDGDFYGPAVNLASRIAASPRRDGAVSDEFHTTLLGQMERPGGGRVRRQGPASPAAEGLGRVQLWACDRPGPEPLDRAGTAGASHGAGSAWPRFSTSSTTSVSVGERLLSGARTDPRLRCRGERKVAIPSGRSSNDPSKGPIGRPAGRPASRTGRPPGPSWPCRSG